MKAAGKRRLLAFLCAGSVLQRVFAQDAASNDLPRYYFDHGAERYTRDDMEKARTWVYEGLSLYPEDLRLKMLKQLLEQSPQPQPSPAPQQQQPQEPQTAQDPQESREGDSQTQHVREAHMEQGAETAEENGQALATMNREDAERMLDALNEREWAERMRIGADRLRRDMGRLPPVDKDW